MKWFKRSVDPCNVVLNMALMAFSISKRHRFHTATKIQPIKPDFYLNLQRLLKQGFGFIVHFI